MDDPKHYLSVRAVAEITGRHQKTVRGWYEAGLECVLQIRGRKYTTLDALRRFGAPEETALGRSRRLPRRSGRHEAQLRQKLGLE